MVLSSTDFRYNAFLFQASQSCCASFRAFQSACPASWVGHFIRKHSFERYKRVLAQQGVNIADDNALGGGKKD
uniref:Transposase n=1 Tax=Angiostrongylus cantonensis TaxID=6313 RepID=A0A0K0DAU2_ANGCA